MVVFLKDVKMLTSNAKIITNYSKRDRKKSQKGEILEQFTDLKTETDRTQNHSIITKPLILLR